MSFDPSKKDQDLVWICGIEPCRRLDTAAWTQAPAPNTSCWWIAHPEGKPSRVLERRLSTKVTTEYAPDVAPLATCQATVSSWYWSPGNERLYVHGSTGANPGGGLFLVRSHFWDRIADRTIVVDGKQYRPLFSRASLPELSFEAKPFSDGGIAQTYGSIEVLNNEAYWDARIHNYIYEGKRIVVKFGVPGIDTYALFKDFIDSFIGDIAWADDRVVFKVEDPRKLQE